MDGGQGDQDFIHPQRGRPELGDPDAAKHDQAKDEIGVVLFPAKETPPKAW